VERCLDTADATAAEGHPLEAIDMLMEANRALHDFALERRLVRARHEAFALLEHSPPAGEPPPVARGPRASGTSPAVIANEELSADLLRDGILEHGSLHVRGVVPPDRVCEFVTDIDRALGAAAAFRPGAGPGPTRWFEPFRVLPPPDKSPNFERGNRRKWVHEAGGVWGADAPRLLFELFDLLATVGIGNVIAEYLGERPALTVDKCTFRKVVPDTNADWHQDGAFLGSGIRTINMWTALSDCGHDAPGLDIVPTRLDRVLETGTEGATFRWSVGPGAVDRVAKDTPVVRPLFEAGDVLFFDDMFLHRTATDPSMTRDRYAIETWFFAPSVYPEKYVPLMA
jgi:hypothetical protein